MFGGLRVGVGVGVCVREIHFIAVQEQYSSGSKLVMPHVFYVALRD